MIFSFNGVTGCIKGSRSSFRVKILRRNTISFTFPTKGVLWHALKRTFLNIERNVIVFIIIFFSLQRK